MTDTGAGQGPSMVPAPVQQGEGKLAAQKAEEIVEALELLPPEKRGVLQSILISQETYSGPIPSPRILAGMEAVVPNSARQVIDMAVKQQDFDHSFSTAVLNSESSYRIYTLLLAALVLVGLLGGAIVCAAIHETAVAITLGTVTGMSVLAGVILKGRDLFQGPAAPQPASSQAPRNAAGGKPKGAPAKRTPRTR